jgi:hypothetical protein
MKRSAYCDSLRESGRPAGIERQPDDDWSDPSDFKR